MNSTVETITIAVLMYNLDDTLRMGDLITATANNNENNTGTILTNELDDTLRMGKPNHCSEGCASCKNNLPPRSTIIVFILKLHIVISSCKQIQSIYGTYQTEFSQKKMYSFLITLWQENFIIKLDDKTHRIKAGVHYNDFEVPQGSILTTLLFISYRIWKI